MSAALREPEADPLYARPLPERPAYATGMLLDANDFADEQTYHRGRLARALAGLTGGVIGGGTLAGLRVTWQSAINSGPGQRPEEIRVEPGVAVDRLGRLIELPRPACLRLPPWFAAQNALDGGDSLRMAAYGGLGRFTSARLLADGGALPVRAVVADVYIRFVGCAQGYTPSFASGPYDALDAVATSRLRDAYELLLALRPGLDDAFDGLPDLGPDLAGIADLVLRRDRLHDAVLDAYPPSGRAGSADALEPLQEHPDGVDRSAVYLARVLLPVGATDPPARSTDDVRVDNWRRRFLPAIPLLSRWISA